MDDFDPSTAHEDNSIEDTKKKNGFNIMEVLNNPALMEAGKALFKKEKSNPDICEITIKAPSEVVLKLFQVYE